MKPSPVSLRREGSAAVLRPVPGTAVLSLVAALLAWLTIAFIYPSFSWAVPANTPIPNTASAVFLSGGSPITVNSNTLIITSVALRTPSAIELFQYAMSGADSGVVSPTEYLDAGSGLYAPLPEPVALGGAALNHGSSVNLVPAGQYHLGEPLFLRVTDPDRNSDPLTAQTVVVTVRNAATGETETLRLTETGPDTGIFFGHLQTAFGPPASGSGTFETQPDSVIQAAYTDALDGADSSTASVLVDPYGLVFNSVTGLPVDGVTVTITDAATGLDALVYADDGATPFPASIVTGSTFVVGGTTYALPPGGYRFPFVLPGTYQYRITTPADFRAPSVVPTAQIQSLTGGPFAIVPGSRAEAFIVDPGPALHIDIPVDPTNNALYLAKTAARPSASAGDLLPYRVTVENVSTVNPVNSVQVADRLPAGFRYQPGSSRIDGIPAADPSLSPDGRTLTYTLGTMAAGRTISITYVASLGAGVRTGPAENMAVAAGALGASSNIATATVQVREDLFRSTATIMGRLLVDGCGDPDRAGDKSVAGVRVLLEDGTAVATDEHGRYHFAAVKPGSHVVQIDPGTLPLQYEALLCSENGRFAGRGDSQFVELQGGALWQADFHLGLKPRMRGFASIQLVSTLSPAEPSDVKRNSPGNRNRLEYYTLVQTSSVPLRKAVLTVLLPPGVTYLPGTAMLDSMPLPDPVVAPDSVSFRLGDAAGDWAGIVWFAASFRPQAGMDRLTARAVLNADTPAAPDMRTPAAENTRELSVLQTTTAVPDLVLRPRFGPLSARLSQRDRAALDKLIRRLRPLKIMHISVAGHTDASPIRGRGLKRFKDNYELGGARARAVAEYIGKGLKLGPDQVEIIAVGPDEPIAPNDTLKGRSENRRVELKVFKEFVVTWTEIDDRSESSAPQTIETEGLRPGETWPDPSAGKAAAVVSQDGMPSFDQAWIEGAQPGFDLLWPAPGHYPAAPAIKIAVKHRPDETIFLRLNGSDVSPVLSDGMVRRRDNAVAASRWSGVHLAEGDNSIEVAAFDRNGRQTGSFSRTIHYSGPPGSVELVQDRSVLTADGRTAPVLALRLLDREGHPARRGVVGEYTVDPPHLSRDRAEALQKDPLAAPAALRENFVVDADGIALVRLQPTTLTGDAVIRVNIAGGQQEVRAWLAPADRDWVLVGLAEGTAGYASVSGNREELDAAGMEDGIFADGRMVFYAKGRIKGKWLLTMAYDSEKKWRQDEQALHEVIDPNRYYLLYGDAAEQRSDAPSSRALYLKLERGQFYALFGDYTTGLTVTELSRYNRSLNGFKSELKSGTVDVTAFASDTNQGFIKDEIRGDGTSGLYRLSRGNLVLNSETVTIETRDRFRSEVIVSSQRMSRWLDYTIDHASGTLFFKAPVPNRDGSFNPVFIVVEFESYDGRDLSWNYGGRAAVRPAGRLLEIGATYVHEAAIGRNGDLTGADATVRLGDQTRVRAEIAATRTETAGSTVAGDAYLAEITHRSPRLDGTAYLRRQEAAFGLGQQNGGESGTRKLGASALYRYTTVTSMRAEVFRQYDLATGAVRDMAEIETRYSSGPYSYGAGFRFVEDVLITGETRTSEQVFLNARHRLTDRLSVAAAHDQALSNRNANPDFPTRTGVSAEYRLNSAATAFAAQEFTRGGVEDTSMTRLGLRAAPWSGAALSSALEKQYTERGTRLFSVSGLKQTWQVTRNWVLDAGLDRSSTVRQTASAPAPFSVSVPPASGGEDFTALSLGAACKAASWTWTGRIEQRHAAAEDKRAILIGAVGEPMPGLGISAAAHAFRTDPISGSDRINADVRLGLAYRPAKTDWIVLDRIEYRVDEQNSGAGLLDGRRIVNNLVVNHRAAPRHQLSFQYGAKYVAETIDAADYSGYTDLAGIEYRYDVTPAWDLGLRWSQLHTRETGQRDYSTGVSVGHALAANMWISVGYNVAGFTDRDFSQAEYTSEGLFLKLRMKFDQASARNAVKWFSGL